MTLMPDKKARRGGRQHSNRMAVEDSRTHIVNFTSAQPIIDGLFIGFSVFVYHA